MGSNSISKMAARHLRILSGCNGALLSVRFFSDSTLAQEPIASTAIDSASVSPSINTAENHSQLNNNKKHSAPSSLKHAELAKFSAIADTWFKFSLLFWLIFASFLFGTCIIWIINYKNIFCYCYQR